MKVLTSEYVTVRIPTTIEDAVTELRIVAGCGNVALLRKIRRLVAQHSV